MKLVAKKVKLFFFIMQSCPRKHIKHRWCSQPLLNNGLHSGDLMIAAAVLCSGNNFSKVELMAKILKLHFPSQSSFTRMQRTYLVPEIEEKWDEHLRSFRAELEDKDVVLLGRFVGFVYKPTIFFFLRGWTYGQSWPLCQILYIFHDGE